MSKRKQDPYTLRHIATRVDKNGAKAKQEQSEREAAVLRGFLLRLGEAFEMQEGYEFEALVQNIVAYLRNTENLATQLRKDRDAERTQKEEAQHLLSVEAASVRELQRLLTVERTQKEALRMELEDRNRRLIEVASERNGAHVRALDAEEKRDALRAENEGLLSALHLIAGTHNEETSSPRACAAEAIAKWSRAQQPAEAAPVAKAEAPSEPAGWVPKVGEFATVKGVGGNASRIEEVTHRIKRARLEGGKVHWNWEQLEPAPGEQKETGPRLWFVVEGQDGSYSTCQAETEARELLKRASEWSFVTRTRPVPASREKQLKPAPQPPARRRPMSLAIELAEHEEQVSAREAFRPTQAEQKEVAVLSCGWCAEHRHTNGDPCPVCGSLARFKPAPKPPAPDRPVMMGEMVEALQKAERSFEDGYVTSISHLCELLATELEDGKP